MVFRVKASGAGSKGLTTHSSGRAKTRAAERERQLAQ